MIIIFVSEAGNLLSSRYAFGPHLFKMKKMIDFSILLSIFSTSDGSSLSINFETMNENRENRCDFVANWTWEASSNQGYAVCNTTYPFYQLNDHKKIFFYGDIIRSNHCSLCHKKGNWKEMIEINWNLIDFPRPLMM